MGTNLRKGLTASVYNTDNSNLTYTQCFDLKEPVYNVIGGNTDFVYLLMYVAGILQNT